jgi:hypothetical protein
MVKKNYKLARYSKSNKKLNKKNSYSISFEIIDVCYKNCWDEEGRFTDRETVSNIKIE